MFGMNQLWEILWQQGQREFLVGALRWSEAEASRIPADNPRLVLIEERPVNTVYDPSG